MSEQRLLPHLRTGSLVAILAGAVIGLSPSVREWVTKEYYASSTEKALYALVGGVLSLGVSSYIQSPIDGIVRRRQASEDVSDNVMVQRQWETLSVEGDKPPQLLAPSVEKANFTLDVKDTVVSLVKTVLSSAIARTKLPVLIVGSTGNGKTTLLMNVVGELLEMGNKVTVFDGKPKINTYDYFNGDIDYYPFTQVEDAPSFVQGLISVYNEMCDVNRTESSPRAVAIVDEVNNAKEKAEAYVIVSGSKEKETQQIVGYNKLLLSQGRGKNYPVIETTHEANADSLGISAGLRTSYKFVILASPGSTDNLELILSGTVKLIQNDNERERLRNEFEQKREQFKNNFFALTNIRGDWEFLLH